MEQSSQLYCFTLFTHGKILIVAILSGVVCLFIAGGSATGAASDSGAAIYSTTGTRLSVEQVLVFPDAVETSSLVYDVDDSCFYTTIDKGTPHIIRFRVQPERIEILDRYLIEGLDQNYDFEGLELIRREGLGKYFQISTERYWQDDSLVCPAVDVGSMTYISEHDFRLLPDGAGGNNNLEGIAWDPKRDLFLLAKEHTPFGLYVWSEKAGQVEIATQAEFEQAHSEFIEATLTGHLSAKRLAGLKKVSISGLAFDSHTGSFLGLNRYGRSIIAMSINPSRSPAFAIEKVWALEGIDYDQFLAEGISDWQRYGQSEGLALVGTGKKRKLAIITDPGVGNQGRLFIFPFPE